MQIAAEALGTSGKDEQLAANTRVRDPGANPTLFLFIREEKKDDSRAAPKGPKGAGKTPFSLGEKVAMTLEGCGRRELALPAGATKGVDIPLEDGRDAPFVPIRAEGALILGSFRGSILGRPEHTAPSRDSQGCCGGGT